MLNVRKYRATTTRDALELVKKDLGEDAFVLETKKVRTGGFLGMNARTEIEVSAAASEVIAGRERIAVPAKSDSAEERLLDLKDDAAAAPDFSAFIAPSKEKDVISAIAARAASASDFEERTGSHVNTVSLAPETVEINPEAPRFVLPRGEGAKRSNVVDKKRDHVAVRPASFSDRDLELLRAELREVKFSLGTLANLQNAVLRRTNSNDLGVFGETIDPRLQDVFQELTDTGVPVEIAREFVRSFARSGEEYPIDPVNYAKAVLLNALPSTIDFEPEILKGDEGSVLAIIGSTGVGKTTTAAKLAARAALHEQHRVELVTLDTYRIAAVQQLKTYAEIIGAGCHVVRTVLELDAVLARLPKDAKVLIDTTGRNPHDLSDQVEFSEFLKRRSHIRKCLVMQATTHPADAAAAVRKFQMYGADCLAVTKMDETTRPGAMIETIIESSLPLAYLGTGQRVPEDLQIATAESLSNAVLAARP